MFILCIPDQCFLYFLFLISLLFPRLVFSLISTFVDLSIKYPLPDFRLLIWFSKQKDLQTWIRCFTSSVSSNVSLPLMVHMLWNLMMSSSAKTYFSSWTSVDQNTSVYIYKNHSTIPVQLTFSKVASGSAKCCTSWFLKRKEEHVGKGKMIDMHDSCQVERECSDCFSYRETCQVHFWARLLVAVPLPHMLKHAIVEVEGKVEI